MFTSIGLVESSTHSRVGREVCCEKHRLLDDFEYRYGPVVGGAEADVISQLPPSDPLFGGAVRQQNYGFDGPRGCLSGVDTQIPGGSAVGLGYGCANQFCSSCGSVGSGPLAQTTRGPFFDGGETFFYNDVQRLAQGWVHQKHLGEHDKFLTYDLARNRTQLRIQNRPDNGKDLTFTVVIT